MDPNCPDCSTQRKGWVLHNGVTWVPCQTCQPHTHRDANTVPGIYENCECGAVRQRTDLDGTPIQDEWHLCRACVLPGWAHVLDQKES